MERITDNIWLFIGIFLVFDVVLVSFVLWRKFRKDKLFGPQREYLRTHWNNIETMFNTDPRAAIVEADKLLDYGLKIRFQVQASVGQNLKTFGRFFSDLEGLWKAHKLRNQIVHELNYKVSERDTLAAKMSFYRALKDLGM